MTCCLITYFLLIMKDVKLGEEGTVPFLSHSKFARFNTISVLMHSRPFPSVEGPEKHKSFFYRLSFRWRNRVNIVTSGVGLVSNKLYKVTENSKIVI